MVNRSERYLNEFKKNFLNEYNYSIKIELTNIIFQNIATVYSNAYLDYGHPKNIFTDTRNVSRPYVTLEDGLFPLNGKCEYAPINPIDTNNQGYVSFQWTNAMGIFDDTPIVNITNSTSTEKFNLSGITLVFDNYYDTVAKDFTISFYNKESLVYIENVSENTLITYELAKDLENITRISIKFNSLNFPNRRLRINKIYLGLIYEVKDEDGKLNSLSRDEEIHPMCVTLPQKKYSIELNDIKNEFNPENPTGIFKYFTIHTPISVEYYYPYDNGDTELIMKENSYLQNIPSNSANKVTISSNSFLETLTIIYDEFKYQGNAFKNLGLVFDDIYKFCIKQKEYVTMPKWKIHPKIYTDYSFYNYIVSTQVKVLLQQLCNSFGLFLFEDTDGVINIDVSRYNETPKLLTSDEYIDDAKYLEKVPNLKSIEIKYDEFNDFSLPTGIKEIAKITRKDLADMELVTIKYTPSRNVAITTNTAIRDFKGYVDKCTFINVFNTNNIPGGHTFTITGSELKKEKKEVKRIYSEYGEDCILDLKYFDGTINNTQKVFAAFTKYYSSKKRYTINCLSDITMLAHDTITTNTQFVNNIRLNILKSNFKNGAKQTIECKDDI